MSSLPLSALFAALALSAAPLLGGCVGDDSTQEATLAASAGYFRIFRGADDQYYFHLVAGNHELVLRSEGYRSRSGAENGIASVKANGVRAENYRILEARDGRYYFNLVAANGEIIATSEMYATKFNAKRGMATVMKLLGAELRIEAT